MAPGDSLPEISISSREKLALLEIPKTKMPYARMPTLKYKKRAENRDSKFATHCRCQWDCHYHCPCHYHWHCHTYLQSSRGHNPLNFNGEIFAIFRNGEIFPADFFSPGEIFPPPPVGINQPKPCPKNGGSKQAIHVHH